MIHDPRSSPTGSPPAPVQPPGLWALILWPSVITLLVNVARCAAQVHGTADSATGGSGQLLGISWLPFVFGIWFALRLRRGGSYPRLRLPWLWALLAFGAIAVAIAVGFGFGDIDRGDASPQGMDRLRSTINVITGVAVAGAIACGVAWPRLAWTCAVYALLARATVLVLTWLAHTSGWDTHYTKFGPAGIELDSLTDTMLAASRAQLLFWVPFSVVAGTLTGSIVAGRRP